MMILRFAMTVIIWSLFTAIAMQVTRSMSPHPGIMNTLDYYRFVPFVIVFFLFLLSFFSLSEMKWSV